jgi:ATP-binding cassette subfamily C (CFTR/MRP) protein 1
MAATSDPSAASTSLPRETRGAATEKGTETSQSTTAKHDSTNFSSSGYDDPEKGAELGDDDDDVLKIRKTSKLTPWREYGSYNPLRWRPKPPVPTERKISKEANAGIFSRLTFQWMGELMKVSYYIPLL